MELVVVNGNLLEQNVDVIVNAWNRNIIPWWLLLPQGVSGAIKKHGGINMFWMASEFSIRNSVNNAMKITKDNGFKSIAFPLIGAGSGGKKKDTVLYWMKDEISKIDFNGKIIIVCYKRWWNLSSLKV